MRIRRLVPSLPCPDSVSTAVPSTTVGGSRAGQTTDDRNRRVSTGSRGQFRPIGLVLSASLTVLLWTNRGTVAEDWPQFRGPHGLGLSHETGLPTTWSEQENLAWKIRLPGPGASSPIVLRDKVFVTCYSGFGVDGEPPGRMEDLRLHLLCVSLSDGTVIWNHTIQPRLPEEERIRDHGYAAATPATDGEALYVFFGKTGVIKFGLDGQPIWQTTVGDRTHGWGSGASPVLYENLVIVNASVESGCLVAIDKATGAEVWRAAGMEDSWNTPHLVPLEGGSTELLISVKDRILAFDPRTGNRLWSCDGIQDYVCPSIVAGNGVVYVMGGRQSRAIAVRAGGRGDVSKTHKLWDIKAGANVTSPVLYRDYLYWVSDRNTTAYCVRTKDGTIMYAERFPEQPYASAIAADERLYVVSRYGGTFVLAAAPEFKILARNRFEDRGTFNASPIIADGALLLRSDHFLYCVRQ